MQRLDKHKGNAKQVVVPLVRRDSIGSSHHVLTFEFETPLEAEAGHFAMIRGATWGESPFLPRPMSLLNGGKRPSILVKVVGEGTRRLAASEPGDMFSILAPLGKPWSPCPPDVTPLLIAGGVGVCPLLFLAKTLTEQGRRPIALYGGRCATDMVLDDEIGGESDLRVATEDGSMGDMGRVTVLLERALTETRGQAKIYACGPEPMMAAVVRMARAAEVACEVSLETVMACGYGVCLGCAVPTVDGGFLYACSDGACVDGYRIDWDE